MTSQIQTRSRKSKSETLKENNVKLNKLNIELESIKKQNTDLRERLRILQAKNVTSMPITSSSSLMTSNNTDMLMGDEHIKSVFKCYSTYVSQTRNDIIFVEPNVSQVLKSGSLYDIMQVLSPLDFEKINLAFFAVSDYNQCIDNIMFQNENLKNHENLTFKGAHWSLLIFHRMSQTFYHLDSIKGINNIQAKLIAKNVNCEFKFKEIETPQQTSNFECGLHVLINAKNILDYVLNNISKPLNEMLSLLNVDSSFILHDTNLNESSLTIPQPLTKNINDHQLWNEVKKKSKQITQFQPQNIKCANRFTPLFNDDSNDLPKITSQDMELSARTKTSVQKVLKPTTTNFKVKILSDSHGRNLRRIMNEHLDNHYTTHCSMKPNGKISNVLNEIEYDTNDMGKNDYTVIIAGTNDINSRINKNCIAQEIKNKIEICSKTNVIISALPYRYDKYSFLNKEIYKVNKEIKNLCDKYVHTHYLPIHNFNRRDYTVHGLHLSECGKLKYTHLIRDKIDEISRLNNYSMNIDIQLTRKNYFLEEPRFTKGNIVKDVSIY
jgi:hypothetical protein